MPSEQQLLEALRRADAAGNKDDARRLAAMVQEARIARKPTSFWQGFGEEAAKSATNAMRAVELTNPFFRGLAFAGLHTPAKAMDAARDYAVNRSPYRGSTAGRVVGGIAASLPTLAIPGGPFVEGAAQGALLSEARGDPKRIALDAVVGGIANKGGQLAGKYVAAPTAERVARVTPVRSLIDAGAGLLKKKPVPLPRFTRGEAALNKASSQGFMASPDVAGIRTVAGDAQRLGLPVTLADTNAKLRALGGSVARFSPDARQLAEETYGPRALGQAKRAVNAIDKRLAPITDIEARAKQIRMQAWNKSDPFYKEAFAQAAPVDETVAEMMKRPAGQAALKNAFRIAQNEGRDPLAMGFDLDAQGEVVVKKMPSMETLDLVKRGMDDVLNGFRGIDGKLHLEGQPEAQSVNKLLQQFKGKLDEISPDYAKARAVYQAEIAKRGALETGYNVMPKTNLPQRQFDSLLGGMNKETLPEAQRGYATAMADEVAKRRLTANPYDSVYGSDLQQENIANLFPKGAGDFRRTYDLEKEMGKTYTELLGGSQTQPRAVTDAQFAGGMAGDLAEAGIVGTLAGGPAGAASGGINAIRRAVGQGLADRARLGMFGAKTKAEQLAPLLYDKNPGGVLDILDELMRKNAEMEARKAAFGKAGGEILAPAAAVGALSLIGSH